MAYRFGVTLAAFAAVIALAAPGAGAHDGVMTAASHAGRGRSHAHGLAGAGARRHTRAVTSARSDGSGRVRRRSAPGRGPVGSGRRLAGRRRARRATAERQGPRLRLDRRQRDRDLPRAGSHPRDRVGSGDGHPDAGQRRHRFQHLLQRPRASRRRPDVHRRREQGSAAQRHRPDAPLRSGDEPVEPRPEHGGRALVSDASRH